MRTKEERVGRGFNQGNGAGDRVAPRGSFRFAYVTCVPSDAVSSNFARFSDFERKNGAKLFISFKYQEANQQCSVQIQISRTFLRLQ